MKYEYKKVPGYEQKKFIENGHTMFEEDVLERLKRLAYLEEQFIINKSKWTPEQMNWISIKDELPKEQCHYLVATPRSFPKNYRGQICEFYTDNKMFYSEGDSPIKDATHWIKLDEPPTEHKK